MSSSSRRKRPSPLYLLIFLVAAVVLYLYQGGYLAGIGLAPASPVTSVTPGEWVQVHFTVPDLSGTTIQQGGLDTLLAADIAAAQKSVDIASFDLDLETIAQALIDAHQRGVQVRLVIDDGNLADEQVQQITDWLIVAGVPIVYDERNAFMHNKFVIVDRQVLWTGSWNLTENGTYLNNNNTLRFAISELAENYTTEFEEMFLDKSFGPRSPANTPYPVLQLSDGSRIENYFAPEDNTRAAILSQLNQAEYEIVFMAFSFTDEDFSRVLLEKARAGVRVRGVFDARNAGSEYSAYSVLKKAGLEVRLDGNPHVMHHKVFIIDGWVVITGSYNFSASAAEENDENVLIISNSEVAQSYLEEFERVFQAGQEE